MHKAIPTGQLPGHFHRNLGLSFLHMDTSVLRDINLPLLGVDYGEDTGVWEDTLNRAPHALHYRNRVGGIKNKPHRDMMHHDTPPGFGHLFANPTDGLPLSISWVISSTAQFTRR